MNGPPRTQCSTHQAYSVVLELREWIFQCGNRPAGDTEAKKTALFLPTIDAFATGANGQFRRHWSTMNNALRQVSIEEECLRLNPPFSLYPHVLEKLFVQGARGIAIVLEWEGQSWYLAPGEAAIDWVDLPRDVQVFQDDSETVYPQREPGTRMVLFDGCFATDDDPHVIS